MNPASRVLAIVQEFKSQSNGQSIADGWEKILALQKDDDSEDQVYIAVQAFLGELKLIQLRLRDLGAPEELFAPHVARLKNSFNPTQLGSGWQSHREVVTSEASLNALQWASWVLKQFDENDLDEASLDALRDALYEQDALLENVALPSQLREILARQALTLKVAINLYKIRGVAPLREAVHKSVGELVSENRLNDDAIKDVTQESNNAVQKGLLLLTKAAEVADKGSKVAKFVKQMYEWSLTGIEHMQAAFPNGILPPLKDVSP